ncbi:MAG: hypothetical protein KIT43_00685 [Bauldia sp.]|nr:hypothetical protein [Bauldia sp.]
MNKTSVPIDYARLLGFDVPMTTGSVDFRDDALADGAGAKVGKNMSGAASGIDYSKLVGFDGVPSGSVDFRADALADHAGAKVSKPETTRRAY